MLKSYLKIAWRNLWNNKGFSAINILGLAIGLATCILITLFVEDELSYDTHNQFADRIYRVNAHIRINGSDFNSTNSSTPLGPSMVKDYPQVENMVRIRDVGTLMVRKGNETIIEDHSAIADSTLFDVFTLPMIAGDPETALTKPYSLVLSESMARKYFNNTDVVGNSLYLNNSRYYKITGVIRDMPAQASMHFDFIRSMAEVPDSRSDYWLSNSYITFLLVRPGVTQQMLNGYLKTATRKYAGPQIQHMTHSTLADLEHKGSYYQYQAMPLTKIHLYSTLANEPEPTGHIQYIYILVFIAVFILLIACVNFMNLSTARSSGRAKEVGIRKSLGSEPSGLIAQFLTESVMTSFIALVLALVMVFLLLPSFNHLSGKSISLELFSPWLVPCLLFTALIVGFLAGGYPAFFLSRFKPVEVLKGKLARGFKAGSLRNGLVVFQFVTAIVLIAGTLVIYSQLHYIQNKKLGYNRDHVLVLHNTYLLGNHATSFKKEVLKISGVEAGTMAGNFPSSATYDTDTYSKNASSDAGQILLLQNWPIDADYIPTLDISMAEGRNFSPEMSMDSSAVIINQTAARMLGYEDPVNKRLYQKGDNGSNVYTIIGVVNDFNVGSLRKKTSPMVFHLTGFKSAMGFRIHTGNIPVLIEKIKSKYHQMAGMAGQPFTYSFLDEDFEKLYVSEQRTGKIFIYFTFFAIFIACLGLFGLITYAAQQRTKEIGIRKVLGASVRGIVTLLSKDFIKLVLIAILIATPIAWYVMNRWLEDFTYRIEIQWWIFVLAGLLALIIALLTVSFQSVKAALMDPVKSLQSD